MDVSANQRTRNNSRNIADWRESIRTLYFSIRYENKHKNKNKNERKNQNKNIPMLLPHGKLVGVVNVVCDVDGVVLGNGCGGGDNEAPPAVESTEPGSL